MQKSVEKAQKNIRKRSTWKRRRGLKGYLRIKKIYWHSKAHKWSEGYILNLKHAVFLSKIFQDPRTISGFCHDANEVLVSFILFNY
jgi:hypothetical protein